MRLIVGISGATGVVMGYRLLQMLRGFRDVETHVVLTESAMRNFELETSVAAGDVLALADFSWDNQDMAARISSGSFVTDGMVVAPTSMKTLAGIVSGFSANLLLRAADVCLKENRRLVLLPREMPFSRVHLNNMAKAADYGCSIIVPALTFYNGLATTEEQLNHVLGKVLMQFGLEAPGFQPWEGVGNHGQEI